MRKRGRPRKRPPGKFYTGDAPDLAQLSTRIAQVLGVARNGLTDQLAMAAGALPTTTELRKMAPLIRKGSGRRPRLERAVLLRDCALIYCEGDRDMAVQELRKIGGWLVSSEKAPPILEYASAALTALGQPTHESLRRQVRQAIKMLE